MKNILVEINDHHSTVRTALGELLFIRRRVSWHSGHPIVDIQFSNGLVKMTDAELRELIERGRRALVEPTFDADISGAAVNLDESWNE